jgi:hypothetical protein
MGERGCPVVPPYVPIKLALVHKLDRGLDRTAVLRRMARKLDLLVCSLVVDLERRCVVDLLPDRLLPVEVETVN